MGAPGSLGGWRDLSGCNPGARRGSLPTGRTGSTWPKPLNVFDTARSQVWIQVRLSVWAFLPQSRPRQRSAPSVFATRPTPHTPTPRHHTRHCEFIAVRYLWVKGGTQTRCLASSVLSCSPTSQEEAGLVLCGAVSPASPRCLHASWFCAAGTAALDPHPDTPNAPLSTRRIVMIKTSFLCSTGIIITISGQEKGVQRA